MIVEDSNRVSKTPKQPKTRVKADYGVRELYKYYQEKTEPSLRIPYKQFTKVLDDLNTELVNDMLLNSAEIKIPYIGYLRIRKKKMNFMYGTDCLRVDWKATKAANKKVFHLNDHRDNHRYRFYWCKGRLKGIKIYSFIPTRTNKRALAHILKNNPEIDYFE